MQSIRKLLKISALVLLGVLLAMISATLATAGSFLILASVSGSYIIRRYEILNTPPPNFSFAGTDPRERFLGVIGEAAAAFACALLYPFGYFTSAYSRNRLVPGERPLILCHGYMANRSNLLWLGWRLRRAGRHNVFIPNFRPASAPISQFAEMLSREVTAALEMTGAEKVDLVGHSMGGLVIRYYIERLGGARFVENAITIGAPHCGTKTAVLSLFRTASQFCPNAPFIEEFNAAAPAGSVNMVAIWSEFDNIVLPPQNAMLPEPYKNAMVKNVGHVALLFSGQVFSQVRRALNEKHET
ncbi:MAG: alpha/beta fold hydrolase [Candidatus Abyssobacteria bacterium SURF_5]|uniref:Alpha/beta fold hydrolase n=1 Tax=Abyssobacteria bacterium (strain SURF_5) TaxID=2093360 RepID=A0A3A4NQJ4_ABYX5|nr:MAG: alpha/beta fold hydrolase [Candidatus Abyssubacteria bacterium SURF_5]